VPEDAGWGHAELIEAMKGSFGGGRESKEKGKGASDGREGGADTGGLCAGRHWWVTLLQEKTGGL